MKIAVQSLLYRLLPLCYRYSLIVLTLALWTGCKLPLDFLADDSGPAPIYISRDSFMLAWEAEEPLIAELPSSVHHFNIYYRKLHEKKWRPLKSTGVFKVCSTISVMEMDGYGSYEIGIAEVLNNGTVREIHKSTDFTAKPAGGWYLIITEP
ncbi:hypothetical protein [Marispirochaeta sp.]|uniref:hypothetical protein n=1 Tax=Marispirochaeta sp. TaxID=2038653 RepID=UPI0029C78B5C|nr:hypothetical protein [Marispirochaeta sp.]